MARQNGSAESRVMRYGWPAALLLAAFTGTTVTACLMPFVALAVVSAATQPVRRAVGVVTTVWVVNQAIGFGLLHYPRTGSALGWGVAMLAASLAAMGTARTVLQPEGDLVLARLAVAAGAAFAVYEGLLYVYAGFAGGRETFTAAIVLRIAANEAGWTAALVALRLGLARMAPRWFGPRLGLRTA